MKLVWMKSNLPLSVLIRAVTGQECSHFAFVFETKAAGLMFQSDLLGTAPAFYETALKTHTVVHQFDLPLPPEQEDAAWDLIVSKYDGKPYNYMGILYLGWRFLLKRAFGLALPLVNRWATPGTYFCDQLYDVLNQLPGVPKINVMSGMDTPHDVWVKFSALEATK